MSFPQHSQSFLLVRFEDTAVGLSAESVREVVRAVWIAPLPGAPPIIEGAINLHGEVVPVVDVRARLGLPAAELSPGQFLIVLTLSDRSIAVRVDDVDDVVEFTESDVVDPQSLSPTLRGLNGVAAVSGGAVVIHDVEAFLSQAERAALDSAAVMAE